jgi:hypothetical protein
MPTDRLRTVAAILIVPLMLSACATLNEAECETANWRDLGQRNGQEGRASSYIAEHEKACSGFGLPVDGASWRAGWEIGIRQYCTPQNGLREGREGSYYSQSCPSDVAPGFLRTYAVGKRVYEAKRERESISDDIDRLHESIGSAEDEKARSELQTKLTIRQSELRSAQDRLLYAEREADRILYSTPYN